MLDGAAAWVLLAAIVLSSSWLFLRGLDNDYITLWDEAIHVNVVRNLIADCCTPTLHLPNHNLDYRDWTDNHTWLHKPPLPFLINAALAAPWPNSLLALRIPSLLFAEAIVVVVFVVGLRFFDRWSAALAAALFAFNHFTFELVQGRQFSGIPDLTLVFFLGLALYCLLAVVRSPQRKYFVAFGVFSGAAFLCKDALAFIPFGVLGVVVLHLGWRKHAGDLIIAVGIALLIAASSAIYLAIRFPVEALHEQSQRVAHLFQDVEGWARPIDYYLTVYSTRVTSPLLVGAGYLSIVYGLMAFTRRLSIAVLAMWPLSYVLVLSWGVSKIPNFIYPILPVQCLLLAVVLRGLWQHQQAAILATSSGILASAAILYLNVFGSDAWVSQSALWRDRFALVFLQLALFAAVFAGVRMTRIRPRPVLTGMALAVALSAVIGVSVRSSLATAVHRPRDYTEQMALRQAALALRGQLHRRDVVLVKWTDVDKGYLYVKFWSGLESFEIDDLNTVGGRLAANPQWDGVYLLVDAPAADLSPSLPVSPGYVYKVR